MVKDDLAPALGGTDLLPDPLAPCLGQTKRGEAETAILKQLCWKTMDFVKLVLCKDPNFFQKKFLDTLDMQNEYRREYETALWYWRSLDVLEWHYPSPERRQPFDGSIEIRITEVENERDLKTKLRDHISRNRLDFPALDKWIEHIRHAKPGMTRELIEMNKEQLDQIELEVQRAYAERPPKRDWVPAFWSKR